MPRSLVAAPRAAAEHEPPTLPGWLLAQLRRPDRIASGAAPLQATIPTASTKAAPQTEGPALEAEGSAVGEAQMAVGRAVAVAQLPTRAVAGLAVGAARLPTRTVAGLAAGAARLPTRMVAGLAVGATRLPTRMVADLAVGAAQLPSCSVEAAMEARSRAAQAFWRAWRW